MAAAIEYVENKDIIAKRVARIFKTGDIVDLGIGLPTHVANFIPSELNVILLAENGLLGRGPAPVPGQEDRDLTNAGGAHVTVLPRGCFFDSATSFGIIRGGHVDYSVLGTLEVDQEGSLANYEIPGKLVPGMGGAMDLVAGSRIVVVATAHFDKSGASKLKRRCTLPLTAFGRVSIVVTDLGYFEVKDGKFHLIEWFEPYTPAWIREKTDADVVVTDASRCVSLD